MMQTDYFRARLAEEDPDLAWVRASKRVLAAYDDVTTGRNCKTVYGRAARLGLEEAVRVLEFQQYGGRADYPGAVAFRPPRRKEESHVVGT